MVGCRDDYTSGSNRAQGLVEILEGPHAQFRSHFPRPIGAQVKHAHQLGALYPQELLRVFSAVFSDSNHGHGDLFAQPILRNNGARRARPSNLNL